MLLFIGEISFLDKIKSNLLEIHRKSKLLKNTLKLLMKNLSLFNKKNKNLVKLIKVK